MKNLRCLLFFTLALGVFAGCNRAPQVQVKKDGGAEKKEGSVFTAFLANTRYPDTPRDSEDWARYRDALQPLAGHFAKTEVIERMRLSPEVRKFLESEVGLNAAELSDVSATSFRTDDAHYLDECFLLRSVARFLEVPRLESGMVADIHFRWVMRNLLPHEQGDTNTPPAFSLRGGHGSPLERAVVFLALLRQVNIDGCLIVVPDSVPLRFLVAVHEPDNAAGQLRLFDTRLSLPVVGQDGKSVATLAEVVQRPALLQSSGITADEVKKLEAWLVTPQHALAPRMLELQLRLRSLDPIVLHVNAVELQKKIAKATSIPVKPWHTKVEIKPSAADAVPAAIAPTRWLSAFLPKQDGGTDETNRTDKHLISRLPLSYVLANYNEMRLTDQLLPRSVFQTLFGISRTLLTNYELHPREMYLRGLLEPMARRLERIQAFARDESLIGLTGDPKFRKELDEWQKAIVTVDAQLQADPRMQGKVEQALQAMWLKDQFLGWLIDLDKDKQLVDRQGEGKGRKDEKTILTKILAVGMRDYFERELSRMQADAAQERAEHSQALLHSQGKANAAAMRRSRQAWENASSAWANFYLENVTFASIIHQHRVMIGKRSRDEVLLRVSLIEKLHADLQKLLHGKLCLAECKEALEGSAAATKYLAGVKKELESLEKDGAPLKELQALRHEMPQLVPPQLRPYFQMRLDLLARDWGETGHYSWMKKHIDQRVAPTQPR